MTDFVMLTNQFIMEYLVAARDLSPNTVLSHKDSIMLPITFTSNVHGKGPEVLKIADTIVEHVEEFPGWLESERTNNLSTRNIRLAAIHSLFRYLRSQQPERISHSRQILSVPVKKTAQTEVIYLDATQMEELLAALDATTAKGKRDLALLCLLHDSECRMQELAGARMSGIRFIVSPQVTPTGKGRKTRTMPLMRETVAIFRNYIDCYNLDTPRWADMPLLFYHRGKKLTEQGITYILQKYAEDVGIGKIAPHTPRYNRVVHLTEADIDSAYIQDFLGRTNLKVTQIYSKANAKMKWNTIEKLAGQKTPLSETDSSIKIKGWVDDKDLVIWLNSLGHQIM